MGAAQLAQHGQTVAPGQDEVEEHEVAATVQRLVEAGVAPLRLHGGVPVEGESIGQPLADGAVVFDDEHAGSRHGRATVANPGAGT